MLLKTATETNCQWSDKNMLASCFGMRARLLLWPIGKGKKCLLTILSKEGKIQIRSAHILSFS